LLLPTFVFGCSVGPDFLGRNQDGVLYLRTQEPPVMLLYK